MCRTFLTTEEISSNRLGKDEATLLKGLQRIEEHVEEIDIMLYVVLAVLGIVVLYFLFQIYKSCHFKLTEQLLTQSTQFSAAGVDRRRTGTDALNRLRTALNTSAQARRESTNDTARIIP